MNKGVIRKVIGILLLVVNVLWLLDYAYLLYAYQNTNILWFYMFPDWFLFLNMGIGIIGVYLGVLVLLKKISPWRAALINGVTLLLITAFLFWGF